MINYFRKTTVLLFLLSIATAGFAQANDGKPAADAATVSTPAASANAPIDMATGLYQSGKIYVVVIVIAVILLGIIGYLTLLDRKISKLEKEIENK
jgi:CcmD family protein